MDRQSTGDFWGSVTILCDITTVDTRHSMFAQTQNVQHQMCPDANCGLCVIMMCQYRLTDCSKCTTMVEGYGQ